MSLWNKTDTSTDAGKPKHLSTADKKNTYATNEGWVIRHGGEYTDANGKVRKKEEILVAIGGLAGANATALLANSTISAIEFSSSTIDVNGTVSVVLTYNEEVQVIGVPTLPVVSANTTANTLPAALTVSYASGNNTNRLTFTGTAWSNSATYTFANTGLAISGTIKDAASNTINAEKFVQGYFTGANSTIGTLTAS